jgi:hypothetical protein
MPKGISYRFFRGYWKPSEELSEGTWMLQKIANIFQKVTNIL